MLNEDFADRTLPPTERRRREARSRGEVARSRELTSAAVFLAASCLFWSLAPSTIVTLGSMMRTGLTTPQTTSLTITNAAEISHNVGQIIVASLWPFMLAVLVSGIAANLVQTGWLWIPDTLTPQFRGGSLFSWERMIVMAGLVVRVVAFGFVLWRFGMTHQSQLLISGMHEPMSLLAQLGRMLGELAVQLSLVMMVLALLDYGIQFWRNEARLKMTIEERRREQREDALDPRIKQKLFGRDRS